MKRKYNENFVFITKKCENCGKEITRMCFNEYSWKIKNKYFCCYSCMRKYEKEHQMEINRNNAIF